MGGAATHPQLIPHCDQTLSSHHHTNAAGRRYNPFPEGSLVEVRTNEAGFEDTFFSGTVISPATIPPRKGCKEKSNKILVEYHNLLEADGLKRLKEYVDVSCARPFPVLQEIVEDFEPDDAVDAFYAEGWWIGVVTRVLKRGERRYVVTFQYPPDEREFGFSDLRVHWDWVNGSWVRPVKQSIAGLMFDVGRKVEVSFDREDCQDAWFPATIHQDLGNGAYLIEYPSAISDNESQIIKVKVDSLHLRPCPPLLKVKNFVVLEKVDALFDSGWWSGVINKELENSRYIVFFRPMNMEKEFNQSELRSHMNWNDGKWFTSSQLPQDVSILSSDGGMHDSHTCENSSASVPTVLVNNLGDGKDTFDEKTSSSLTLANDHSEQLTSDSQKVSHATSLTKRRRHHLSESRNAVSQSLKKHKEGTVLGAKQQEIHDRTIKEMLTDSVSPVSGNNVKTTGKQSATGDHSSDNPSWGKRTRGRQGDVGGKINSTSSYMKNSSAQMSQVENPELDVGGKEPDVVDKTAEDVQNECTKKGIEVPLIIGLPCGEMVISGFGKSRGKRSRGSNSKEIMNIVNEENQQLHESTIQKIEDIKLIEIGELSEKRRRGRPRKIPTESIQTPLTGNSQNGFVDSDDLNKKDDDPHRIPEVEAIVMDISSPIQEKTTLNKEKPINGQADPKDRKGIMTKRTSPRKREEKVVKEVIRPEENRVLKRGRRQSASEKNAVQVQDSLGALGGNSAEVNSTLEVNNAVCEAPSNEFENQPLSKWFEGIHSPSTVDGPRLPAVIAVEQCIENGKKQRDDVVLEEVSEKHQESEIQSLPFVKNNTFLWKTIESMEVFRKIPQNPHFQPLEHIKESLREGLAVGHMVTFSSVVEKTCKLQWDDPKSVTDDILETLAELEKHGFDVRGVQDRVAELLALKDKEEKAVDEVKGLNDEIKEHHREKDNIEEEMEEINEQIQKLQEKLSVAGPAKGKKEDEIASLGARLKETEESIKSVRCEFEGIVSSTW